jgi:hypothetical protein
MCTKVVLPPQELEDPVASSGHRMQFADSEQGDLADVRQPPSMAADSNSDSNTGGSRRPAACGSGGGVQVRNACERL